MAHDPPPVREYTFRELREIAERFLGEHHPSGELPVPIEEIIEFKFDLDIVPVPGLLSGFDIDAFLTSDVREIRIDAYIQERVSTRYRASLTHELAHLLLHRDFFAQVRFTTVEEWKAALGALDQGMVDMLERQAKSLGALILVPPNLLAAQFKEICTKLPAGTHLEQLSEKGRAIVIGGVAKTFEVSATLMKRRLNQDRLL